MIYIENIYVCLMASTIIGAMCSGKRGGRAFIFIMAGYTACLFSAYVNSFFMGLYGSDLLTATVEIAPVVEEILKFLPLLFYLVLMEPRPEEARLAIITISASFATFENVCYLVEHGSSDLAYLLIRGLGSGAMHIVCGALVGYGLVFVWKRLDMKIAGTFGLLCCAVTYHAVYNLFVSGEGAIKIVGYFIPITTVLLSVIIMNAYKTPFWHQK